MILSQGLLPHSPFMLKNRILDKVSPQGPKLDSRWDQDFSTATTMLGISRRRTNRTRHSHPWVSIEVSCAFRMSGIRPHTNSYIPLSHTAIRAIQCRFSEMDASR